MIIWADGHWTTAPTARGLLREIGFVQFPKMNVRQVRQVLLHRYQQLTGVKLRTSRRSKLFVTQMAEAGMFRLYVA